MRGLVSTLRDIYIRFLVWLGAAAPAGYEHLIPAEEAGPRTYTVKEGETIFAVARKFGVHYNRIAQANGIEDPETVQAGQTLIIPPPEWDPASGPLVEQPPETAPTPIAETEPSIEEPEPIAETEPPTAVFPEPAGIEPSAPLAEEATPEEPDWLATAQTTSTPAFDTEEPTLLPDELDSSRDQPEWLLAMEPSPEQESDTADAPSTAETATLSDRLEWLVATEPPQVEPEEVPVQEIAPTEPPPVPAAQLPLPEEAVPEKNFLPAKETTPPRAEAPAAVDSASVPPPVTPSSEPGISPEEMLFRYEVQRGDTLNSVAKRYGVTVKEIIEANDITDPGRIFPGQKLTIPGYMSPKPPQPEPEPSSKAPPPSSDEFFVYTVAEGDTISTIAKRYGVTVRQLVEANNVQDPNLIRIGQRLLIPDVLQPPEAQSKKPTPEPQLKPGRQPEPPPTSSPSVKVDPDFPPIGPLEAIRAFYVSYFAIGHADFRKRVFDLLDATEFNAVVIDVKGDHGWISYPTQIPVAHEIDAARPSAKDFDQVMSQFKDRGVYTIARVVTFKDNPLAKNHPELAVRIQGANEIWQDREKLGWSDPFLKPVWDYNIQIAVEAAKKGFDEIQFDYVRFPTSNQVGTPLFSQETTKETRIAAITSFLNAARGQLEPYGAKVAVDTFGYTCWRKDDTLIGQDIERMGRYVDVLSPKLYPSAFGSGIPDYKFAIAYPYEVVHESARRAVGRLGQSGCAVRPWIQDFPDYRFDKRVYGEAEIRAQIKGCFDAGGSGFMVWNPDMKYTGSAYAPVTGRF